jgi:hypothetical protein
VQLRSAPFIALGRAEQVDPIKPTLKAPGTKHLKLKYVKLLSLLLQFRFQFQLAPVHLGIWSVFTIYRTMFVLGSIKVGRCSFTL